jgi:hypothetical protein
MVSDQVLFSDDTSTEMIPRQLVRGSSLSPKLSIMNSNIEPLDDVIKIGVKEVCSSRTLGLAERSRGLSKTTSRRVYPRAVNPGARATICLAASTPMTSMPAAGYTTLPLMAWWSIQALSERRRKCRHLVLESREVTPSSSEGGSLQSM